MNNLGMAYSMKKRASKMAKGGMAECAHGGPAECAEGCYAEGGMAEASMKESDQGKMAKGRSGMIHPKHMAKSIMMAKGGMVDSEESSDLARKYQLDREDQPEMGMDNTDIDMKLDSVHDDQFSPESDAGLMEDEDYEEGMQSKMKRKGDLLSRVMAKIHA